VGAHTQSEKCMQNLSFLFTQQFTLLRSRKLHTDLSVLLVLFKVTLGLQPGSLKEVFSAWVDGQRLGRGANQRHQACRALLQYSCWLDWADLLDLPVSIISKHCLLVVTGSSYRLEITQMCKLCNQIIT